MFFATEKFSGKHASRLTRRIAVGAGVSVVARVRTAFVSAFGTDNHSAKSFWCGLDKFSVAFPATAAGNISPVLFSKNAANFFNGRQWSSENLTFDGVGGFAQLGYALADFMRGPAKRLIEPFSNPFQFVFNHVQHDFASGQRVFNFFRHKNPVKFC